MFGPPLSKISGYAPVAISNALTLTFQIFQKMDLIALCFEWLIYILPVFRS